MEGFNTTEELLTEIFRREKNIINILTGMQLIYTTNDSTVVIDWEDTKGVVTKFEISSIASLNNQITLLQQNQESMSGVGVRNATLKLPDGTIKTIISSKLPVAPKAITNIDTPKYFYYKTNKFQQVLTNPITYSNLDLNGKVDERTNQVKLLTYFLTLDNSQKLDFFNNTLKGKNTDYKQFLTLLQQQNIVSENYEEVLEISPRIPKYTGKFSVLNINKRTIKNPSTNTDVLTVLYRLNTISFTEIATSSTVSLKIGDQLIINNNDLNTIYEISYIDTGTNEVALINREGYYPVTISTDTFVINSKFLDQLLVQIPLSKDKYTVLFVKAINSTLNVEADYWGNSVAFFTNELVDFVNLESNINFLSYFTENVASLENSLTVLQEQNLKPISTGVLPPVPVLDVASLKVEVVNSHKQEASLFEDIRKKYSEKKIIETKITATDTSISQNKTELSTNNNLTVIQRQKLEDDNSNLYTQRASLVREFNSKVDEINAKITDNSNYVPKYEVQGFANIPVTLYQNSKEKLNPIEVIGIEVQYRYLTLQNSITNTATFDNIINSNGTKEKAVMSKWNAVPITTIRQKDPVTKQWMSENLNDSESVNINQIRIPISRGENVEIRVRSISEIGYPYSPLKSEWSEPVQFPFPQDLIDSPEAITETSRNEQILVKFNRELSVLGLDVHTKDSETLGDKYFAHFLDNIGTSEQTPEAKPKTAQTVINEIRTDVGALQAILLNVGGQAKITLTDESGAKIKDIANNDTINLFVGYYKNLVASASVPKGEIVTKLYYVEIQNISDADLELLSYVPGASTERIPVNDKFLNDDVTLNPYWDNYTGYIYNKEEFNSYRKFWNAPLSLRGVTNNNTLYQHHLNNTNPFIELPSFQSSQVKGSFVFSRDRDITLNTELYYADDTSASNQILKPLFSGPGQSFIWDGSNTPISNVVVGGGGESDFCIHIDHPELQYTAEFMQGYSAGIPLYQTSGVSRTLPSSTINTLTPGTVYYPPFIHSKYFNDDITSPNSLIQLRLSKYNRTDQSMAVTDNSFPRKVGFNLNDKYLIGKNTCGVYMYIAPPISSQLSTNSLIYNSGLVIKKGESNKVRIPIIFEARLTDYYGAGSGGFGRVAGDGNKINVTFAKKIGLDILFKNKDLFSFDIKAEITYAPTTAALINNNNQNLLNL